MDFAALPLFSLMKSKLTYMSQRQSVLAQNVANADTPRFKAKDVTAPDFRKMISEAGVGGPRKLHMAITSPMHVAQTKASGGEFKVMERETTDELNPNQNNVVIEEEMAKVADNQAEYQKVLSLYSKTISMFKTAIGNTSGG